MTKRSTTGKPIKQRETERKQHLSKAERERIFQRNVIIISGVIVSAVVLILLYALLNDYFLVPRQEITTVNGVEIKTNDYQARVRAERWRIANGAREIYEDIQVFSAIQNYLTQLSDPQTIGSRILDDMELEVLLKEEAEKRGIDIDEGEVQAKVDEYMQLWTGRSLTPTPTDTSTPQVTETATPLITATASNTPTASLTPSETPLPTLESCAEGEECATVTPLPSATITATPTETPDATETPTSTPLAADDVRATVERYESGFYQRGDEDADTTRDALYDLFYFDALREALQEVVPDELIESGDLETQRLWADTRHILISVPEASAEGAPTFTQLLCDSEEWKPYRDQTLEIIALLNSGEPFATLAEAFSDDPGSAIQGGALGSVDDVENSSYVAPFKQAIIDGPIGEFIGPVCTQFGFHIIQILDKESRDIPEADMTTLRNQAYTEWESGLLATAEIQRRDDWIERIPDSPTLDDLLGDIIDEQEQ